MNFGQSSSETQGMRAALSNKKKRDVIRRWYNIVYKRNLKNGGHTSTCYNKK